MPDAHFPMPNVQHDAKVAAVNAKSVHGVGEEMYLE